MALIRKHDHQLRTVGGLAVIAAWSALACVACTDEPPTPNPPPATTADNPGMLDSITSACDQHGNRVYERMSAIAVVRDPTCPATGAR